MENVSRGRGRRQEKELSSGAARVEAVVVVLMFFFIGYCRRFCFHVFIAMLRAAKKAEQTRGRQEKMQRERVREGDSNKAKHLNLHNFRSTSQM